MDETWIVRDATPEAVVDWLRELAQQARLEQESLPLRSQSTVLDAAAVDIHMLPLPVRSDATAAGAIYARLPSPAEPFGRILVLALLEPLEGGQLRVELASDPLFPLLGHEITWLFRRRFGQMQRGATGRRTGLLNAINSITGSNHTGAPVLACNVWLEEQLAHLNNPRERMRLFRPWLDRFREVRGCDPADPMRSFRAALASCERRLRRRARAERARRSRLEGEPHSPGSEG